MPRAATAIAVAAWGTAVLAVVLTVAARAPVDEALWFFAVDVTVACVYGTVAPRHPRPAAASGAVAPGPRGRRRRPGGPRVRATRPSPTSAPACRPSRRSACCRDWPGCRAPSPSSSSCPGWCATTRSAGRVVGRRRGCRPRSSCSSSASSWALEVLFTGPRHRGGRPRAGHRRGRRAAAPPRPGRRAQRARLAGPRHRRARAVVRAARPAVRAGPLPVWITPVLHLASQAVYPAAILVAVLRGRMWGLQLAVSRTVLAGLMTVALDDHLRRRHLARDPAGPGLRVGQLVGAAVVAVAVQPARLWLERRVHRLVYGTAATPDHVVRRLGSHLRLEGSAEGLLRGLAEDVGTAMRLESVDPRRARCATTSSGACPPGRPSPSPAAPPRRGGRGDGGHPARRRVARRGRAAHPRATSPTSSPPRSR